MHCDRHARGRGIVTSFPTKATRSSQKSWTRYVVRGNHRPLRRACPELGCDDPRQRLLRPSRLGDHGARPEPFLHSCFYRGTDRRRHSDRGKPMARTLALGSVLALAPSLRILDMGLPPSIRSLLRRSEIPVRSFVLFPDRHARVVVLPREPALASCNRLTISVQKKSLSTTLRVRRVLFASPSLRSERFRNFPDRQIPRISSRRNISRSMLRFVPRLHHSRPRQRPRRILLLVDATRTAP